MKSLKINLMLTFILSLMIVSMTWAQRADIPHHFEKINIEFTPQNGKTIDISMDDDNQIDFTEVDFIQVSKTISSQNPAPWIQLHFADVNLGEKSYLTIRSIYDDDTQPFNAKSIQPWDNWSAFFKGSEVEVTLYVAPNEQNISIDITELLVGDFLEGDFMPERSQCGPNDDRAQSSTPMRDGRLMPLGCTGWNHAGGFYGTAGHCLDASSTSLVIMEFDVPASLSNGTTQPAATINQYPVIYASRDFQNAGVGDDWGFYDVGSNSSSGLTPLQARRSFYHLTRANTTSTIQIRGYGVDDEPPGSSGGRNADNQTLQWHAGPNLGENITSADDISYEYQADTEGGNSGSAVRSFSPDLNHAIGIHTHGGCSTTTGGAFGNKGTSFEANDTEAGLNTFWQTQVEYVDVDHHLSSTSGTAVLPHQSVQTAVNQANAGHGPLVSALELILIAGSNRNSSAATETGGIYAEVFSYSGATNGVVLRSVAGAVKIGPNATAAAPPISNRQAQNTEKVYDAETMTEVIKN